MPAALGFAALPTGAAVEAEAIFRNHQLESQILFLNIWDLKKFSWVKS